MKRKRELKLFRLDLDKWMMRSWYQSHWMLSSKDYDDCVAHYDHIKPIIGKPGWYMAKVRYKGASIEALFPNFDDAWATTRKDCKVFSWIENDAGEAYIAKNLVGDFMYRLRTTDDCLLTKEEMAAIQVVLGIKNKNINKGQLSVMYYSCRDRAEAIGVYRRSRIHANRTFNNVKRRLCKKTTQQQASSTDDTTACSS